MRNKRALSYTSGLFLCAAVWSALPASLRLLVEPSAHAANFIVLNTNDGGPDSLRQAILDANASPGQDVISFMIPGSGVKTIKPGSPLPTITDSLLITGYTQSSGVNLQTQTVELDGSSAGAGVDGLRIAASDCNVGGLAINRFSGAGIRLLSGSRNKIAGNFIGTNANGDAALGNGHGIVIEAGSSNNIIEGSGKISLVSGNVGDGIHIDSDGNKVRGMEIGLALDRLKGLGNGQNGIYISGANNEIASSAEFFSGSTISSNGGHGIFINGSHAAGNTIGGNLLGVNENPGNPTPLPNGGNGIYISAQANNNVIGGPDTNSANYNHRNSIFSSGGHGIRIENSSNTLVQRNLIQNNSLAGIKVDGSSSTGNKIITNIIDNNGGLGIDLGADGVTPNDAGDADAGPNDLQNFPVLTSARSGSQGQTLIQGTFNSKPNTAFQLEFYNNITCDPSGNGEGANLIGSLSLTTGSDGNANINTVLPAFANAFVTATATSPNNNTSEFSRCVQVIPAGVLGFSSINYLVDENAGSVTITVNRTEGSNGTVTVDYSTTNGTATAGADYTAVSGTLTFNDGETSRTFNVPIKDDALVEGTETINLKLSNPTGGASVAPAFATLKIIDNESPPPPIIYALVANRLLSFSSEAPNRDHLISNVPITGTSEAISSIKFRPLNGKLYGLGSAGHLYIINKATGVATQVGTSAITPALSGPAGFSFNPTNDRIRVVTTSNRNLQVNPDTGQVISVDSNLAFAAGDANAGQDPYVFRIANSNNFTGATSTTTYAIHRITFISQFSQFAFATLGSPEGSPVSPNTGQLFTIGGFSSDDTIAIDIADTGVGFVTITDFESGGAFLRRLFVPGPEEFIYGIGQISDIAVAPVLAHVQFSSALYSVNENAGTATVTVRRTGNTDGAATVNYATADGTATAGTDYAPASGTLNFAQGETARTFSIPLQDDSVIEGVETVKLNLSSVAGGVIGPQATATLAIMDEATEPGTNPIDNAEFFVRQHYLDFLNREPEPGGLAFWTNNITKCDGDALCIHQRRIGTSAAFFIENEFQQTGSFIYRLYKGGLGRQPNFAEFTADRSQVVGGTDLDANKVIFADQFVQRPEFNAKYLGKTTADGFVDALIATIKASSGADLSSQRATLVNTYNSGASMTQSRSLTIRAAIEDAGFKQAVYNPSFVLMQYFGYLKRDPEQAGFDFWLNALNNKEPNNYRGMVCAFITSAEYQHRFGSIVTRTNRDCK
jgi:hypothetical protein